jgi:amidohydrolase
MRPPFALLAAGWLCSALMLTACKTAAVEAAAARAQQVAQAAEALRPTLVETRRDLHRHPELSNREERTAQVVAERLRMLGLDEIRTNVAHHGVVALLKGSLPGPVVALRADLDALPFNETLEVPYRSLVPGVKHACGHDAHTAIALGTAQVLSRMRNQMHGTVKFLFEPAEEGPPPGEQGGARMMIQEGALASPRPAAIFGLHVTPELEVGRIGFRAGAAQASMDNFSITIRGKTSQAMSPQEGVDSILVAAECVTALQSIKSRRLDAFEPVILTLGTIHGGERPAVIPAAVKLSGTVRTLNEHVRTRIEQLMRETLAGVTAGYGASFDLQYQRLTRVVYNDPQLVAGMLPSLRRAVGATNLVEVPQRMGAEDFSFYQEVVPGCLLRLGSGNTAKGIAAPIHTPEFDIDEECLVVGVKVLSNLALDFLDQHAREH